MQSQTEPLTLRSIKPQKRDKAPRKTGNRAKLLKRRPGTNMTASMRQKNTMAFTFYCQGMTGPEICRRLELSESTFGNWKYAQNWAEGKERLRDGTPYKPPFMSTQEYDRHFMSETHEDLVACMDVTRNLAKAELGDALLGAARHAGKKGRSENPEDHEELFQKSGDLMRLSTVHKNLYPEKEEGAKQGMSINITAGGIQAQVLSEGFTEKLELPFEVEE